MIKVLFEFVCTSESQADAFVEEVFHTFYNPEEGPKMTKATTFVNGLPVKEVLNEPQPKEESNGS